MNLSFICLRCATEKSIDGFSVAKKSGYRNPTCKKCLAEKSSKHNQTEKAKLRKSEWAKEKWRTDPEYRERHKKHYIAHAMKPESKLKVVQRLKQRRLEDPEHFKRLWKEQHERRKQDPSFRIAASIRASIRKSLLAGRASKTFDLLGYSKEDLKNHLERQFSDGMTWDNFGEWHIDHITPISALRPKNEEEVAKAWCLSNLRPLWARENMVKHNKICFLL